MKTILNIVLMLSVLLGANQIVAQSPANAALLPKHKIIMQLTSADPLVHKGLVKQLNNLKNGWKDSVIIEVVCHGPGMDFLHKEKTTFSDEIDKLIGRGIQFIACENTMKERSITKEMILPEVLYVVMGIGEIVIKQEQGWSYIKAGF